MTPSGIHGTQDGDRDQRRHQRKTQRLRHTMAKARRVLSPFPHPSSRMLHSHAECLRAPPRHPVPGVWSKHRSLLSTSQLAMPACSQPHGELQQEWLPFLSTQLLLECSSPVRVQNPDPLDALPQSCPPSVMHLVDIPQLHRVRQVPDAMRAASRGGGNSAIQGHMVGMLHKASFSSPLGHSPIAFLSLGEAVILVRSSMPVTCK